jgi:hypothetical protein
MTKKEKTKKLILIISLLIICSFLISNYYKNPAKQNSQINPPTSETYGVAILEINGTKYESQITDQKNVYDFMTKLQNEGKITFKDKTYTGMGKFIEEINGRKNGDKNWIYYVNNKKANIGVSNYKINNGDIVSWKYE